MLGLWAPAMPWHKALTVARPLKLSCRCYFVSGPNYPCSRTLELWCTRGIFSGRRFIGEHFIEWLLLFGEMFSINKISQFDKWTFQCLWSMSVNLKNTILSTIQSPSAALERFPWKGEKMGKSTCYYQDSNPGSLGQLTRSQPLEQLKRGRYLFV